MIDIKIFGQFTYIVWYNTFLQMANLMAKRTEPNGLLFLGELLSSGRDFKPKMDELVSILKLMYGQMRITER